MSFTTWKLAKQSNDALLKRVAELESQLSYLKVKAAIADIPLCLMEKDAARYRWLVKHTGFVDWLFRYTKSDERHVDNAIDEAIRKEQP